MFARTYSYDRLHAAIPYCGRMRCFLVRHRSALRHLPPLEQPIGCTLAVGLRANLSKLSY
jgi:hypothetical protein